MGLLLACGMAQGWAVFAAITGVLLRSTLASLAPANGKPPPPPSAALL
jgi:hypothetical protein